MKQIVQAIIALAMITALAGCQSTANGIDRQVTPSNPLIFRLGGDSYTLADYTRRLKQEVGQGIVSLLQQGQTREQIQQLADQNKIRTGLFDIMVRDALLMQYARRNGIGVNTAALDTEMFGQASAASPTRPFSDTTDLRLARAQNQVVFQVQARNTRADMFHARHIVVESEAAADQVLADLKSGVDFAKLAAERSKDTATSATGGDLGWTPRGNLTAEAPEVETAGFSLALRTPTKVHVGNVWHVIEVIARQAGPTAAEKRPFDNTDQFQNSKDIQQFYQDTFIPWYTQLRKEAEDSKDLVIAPGFDPNTVPLPFPEQ